MPGTQDWGAPITRTLDPLPDQDQVPRHQDQVPLQRQGQEEMMMTEMAMTMGTATRLKRVRRLQKPIQIPREPPWR